MHFVKVSINNNIFQQKPKHPFLARFLRNTSFDDSSAAIESRSIRLNYPDHLSKYWIVADYKQLLVKHHNCL